MKQKILIIILLVLSFCTFSQTMEQKLVKHITGNEFVIDTSYLFGTCYIQEGRAGDNYAIVAIDYTKQKYIYWHICTDTIPTFFAVKFGEVFRCTNGNHTLSAIEKEVTK